MPSYPDPSLNDQYCPRCQELQLENAVDTLRTAAHTKTDPKMILSIGSLTDEDENSACPVCRIFATCRLRSSDREENFQLWVVQWSQLYGGIFSRLSSTKSSTVLAVMNSSWVSDIPWRSPRIHDMAMLCAYPPANHYAQLSIRKVPNLVDFDVVNSWISRCRDSHDFCNTVQSAEEITVPFQVIDCETLELIDGCPHTKYAALSYVWGKDSSHSDTIGSSLLATSLLPLIEDAWTATKSLGLKYLWVDRYCITQTNLALKHEQIKRMDLIYGRAEITLIALVEGPSCRLPGVKFHRTTQQHSLAIGDKELVSTLRPPAHFIKNSTWWKRAWTLQEAVLSRRRLYFTPDQVYFECGLMQQCETVECRPAPVKWGKPMRGPWWEPVIDLDADLSVVSLRMLMATYFEREMSYQTDAINAFRGILRRFSHAEIPVKHYFGLPFTIEPGSDAPTSDISSSVQQQCTTLREAVPRNPVIKDPISNSFVCALAWSARNVVRRPGFPSWSWSGWRGVDFHYHSHVASCAMAVWVERSDGTFQDFRSCVLQEGYDGLPSVYSQYIWLWSFTTQVKFLSTSGELISSLAYCDQDRVTSAMALTWMDDYVERHYYHEIEWSRLPDFRQMKTYNCFMALKIAEDSSTYFLLLVGERDGGRERITILEMDTSSDQSRRMWGFRFRGHRRIFSGRKLPFHDEIIWNLDKVRLG